MLRLPHRPAPRWSRKGYNNQHDVRLGWLDQDKNSVRLVPHTLATSGETALSRDVLAAHMRSLLQEIPVQVASLDSTRSNPFSGRLEYSPVVEDLSGEGFQRVGGRLDYVDGQRVTALVYKRRLHQISVFVWPSGTRAIASYSLKLDGFNARGWSRVGMSYRAVSDLNEGELRELQTLL